VPAPASTSTGPFGGQHGLALRIVEAAQPVLRQEEREETNVAPGAINAGAGRGFQAAKR
jgi:hypothetical protein